MLYKVFHRENGGAKPDWTFTLHCDGVCGKFGKLYEAASKQEAISEALRDMINEPSAGDWIGEGTFYAYRML